MSVRSRCQAFAFTVVAFLLPAPACSTCRTSCVTATDASSGST